MVFFYLWTADWCDYSFFNNSRWFAIKFFKSGVAQVEKGKGCIFKFIYIYLCFHIHIILSKQNVDLKAVRNYPHIKNIFEFKNY